MFRRAARLDCTATFVLMSTDPVASAIDIGTPVCFPLFSGYSIYRLAQGSAKMLAELRTAMIV
jgi:hypothetical protein